MSKNSKHNRQSELNTEINRSHNSDLDLIAFVEFLARQAAEEDFKALRDLPNQKFKGEEHE